MLWIIHILFFIKTKIVLNIYRFTGKPETEAHSTAKATDEEIVPEK